MNNFPIKVDTKEYWVSRSMAGAVLLIYNNKILAVRRGPAGDHPWEWCLPGGYLNYDETLEQCAFRELKEETGYELTYDPHFLKAYLFDDPILSNKQVVTQLFIYKLQDVAELTLSDYSVDSEEIDEIKWIPIKDLSRYNWMYNKNLINNIWNLI